jgi:diguanylate cyclase (GGDEF)-like protein/PAS domain S-box-containing protein
VINPPSLINEEARLAALREYDLTPLTCDESFDHIINLATQLFFVPIATLTIVEHEFQFHVARKGVEASCADRAVSFCAHAIGQDDLLVVNDAALDDRFYDNPLVLGEPYIRFYAGVPIRAPCGSPIGTLCIIDTKPRPRGLNRFERNNLCGLAKIAQDKLEVRRLETAQKEGQQRFQQIAANSPDGIICIDPRGRIAFWNGASERIFGYSAGEAIGETLDLIVPRYGARNSPQLLRALHYCERKLLGGTLALQARRKDKTELSIDLSLSKWSEGGSTYFGAIVRDTTARRLSENRLHRLAHFDTLTDLPNRAALRKFVDDILQSKRAGAMLILNLDRFKYINDTLGHDAGDLMIKAVANRLRQGVRASDFVARTGGDEFALFLPDVTEAHVAGDIADVAMTAIGQLFKAGDTLTPVSVSVGIALCPQDASNEAELLICADLALAKAKAEGRNRRSFFDPELKQKAINQQTLEQEMRLAIDRSEFELFYQPQFNIHERYITGAEALLRWRHPQRGLLAPASFISALEASPLAATVGRWVLKTACAQAAKWRVHARDFRMGVNLFTAQFHGDLADEVLSTLKALGLPPNALELEVTENIVLRSDMTLSPLKALHQAGVGIAFDDFGTGYASLTLLKQYPISRLKIDQSFVRNMCTSVEDAALVRSITYLGRSFGLEVIAEGVETDEQDAQLRQIGCGEVQGYLFGRPVSAASFYDTHLIGATPALGVEENLRLSLSLDDAQPLTA